MMPAHTSEGSALVNTRPHSLGLWHEFCGVLTDFSILDEWATLEYDDVVIYITITDITRSQILSMLVPVSGG